MFTFGSKLVSSALELLVLLLFTVFPFLCLWDQGQALCEVWSNLKGKSGKDTASSFLLKSKLSSLLRINWVLTFIGLQWGWEESNPGLLEWKVAFTESPLSVSMIPVLPRRKSGTYWGLVKKWQTRGANPHPSHSSALRLFLYFLPLPYDLYF